MKLKPVRVLALSEMAKGYLFRNGGVWVDDKGTGEILEPEQVIALSDGSLFLREQWDMSKLVFDQQGYVGVFDPDHATRGADLPGIGDQKLVRVWYGKDLAPAWRYMFGLKLAMVNKNMELEEIPQ